MIKYKIALINVFWSEEDQNTRYFVNKNEQDIYFDTKASGHISPLVNFDMRDNIRTRITYKFENDNRLPEELIKSNYAIVYTVEVEGNDETIINRRYFFAQCEQDSGSQMGVYLSLDDIQTNYFGYRVYFNKAFIRRAHLNRFRKLDNISVTFNLLPNSPLFEDEPTNEPVKRLIKRTPLNFEIDTTPGSELNEFIKENIIGWEYVYLTPFGSITSQGTQPNLTWNVYDPINVTQTGDLIPRSVTINTLKTYPFEHTGTFSGSETDINCDCIRGSLICLCAPVYKQNSYLGRSGVLISGSTELTEGGIPKYQITLSTKGIDMFLSMNNNNAYVYARKFSIRPPFTRQEWSSNSYYRNEVMNTIVLKGGHDDDEQFVNEIGLSAFCTGIETDQYNPGESYRQGCLCVIMDINFIPCVTETFSMDSSHRLIFPIQELIDADKNPIYNPKLLSSKYYELDFTFFSQKYVYDPMKVGGIFNVAYNEALTPDITKGYARLSEHRGLYIDDTTQNLTGLVISNDQSLMVANDKLSEVLANNKNYFLQQALQIGGDIGKGFNSGDLLGTGLGITNRYLEFDNMRSSPQQVKNANGNVYFASQIQPFKLAIEEYDILPQDKEKINDYMYLFGFSYNRVDTLENFLNIRAYFNYIEADLMTITAPISNEEKTRLKRKFSDGIRFWNTDMVDYSKENYELELLTYRE